MDLLDPNAPNFNKDEIAHLYKALADAVHSNPDLFLSKITPKERENVCEALHHPEYLFTSFLTEDDKNYLLLWLS